MKQTAVEWLESIISSMILNGGDSDLLSVLTHCKKAKEMEKEQIESAYRKGYTESSWGRHSNSENYYNETYKSE